MALQSEKLMGGLEVIRRMAAAMKKKANWGVIDVLVFILICSAILFAREYRHRYAAPSAPSSHPEMQFAGLPPLGKPMLVDSDAFFSMENLVKESEAERLGDNFFIEEKGGELVMVLGESISFASGEAVLLGDSLAILDSVAAKIRNNTDYRLIISGHTDNLPIANSVYACNWDLSTARAVAVARYLVEQGIAPERITTQGFAEFRPMADNGSEDGRRRNRRVEIALSRTSMVALR